MLSSGLLSDGHMPLPVFVFRHSATIAAPPLFSRQLPSIDIRYNNLLYHHSLQLLGMCCGLPGAHQSRILDDLFSAYNLLSSGTKDMMLHIQESLPLVHSLARSDLSSSSAEH